MGRAFFSSICLLLLAPAALGWTVEEEKRMGRRIDEEIRRAFVVLDDPSFRSAFDLVLSRFEPHLRRPYLEYSGGLIRDDRVNAFALPGGRIYLTTGMRDFLRSKHELAALLGHEVAHVDMSHHRRVYQRSRDLLLPNLLVAVLTRGSAPAMLVADLVSTGAINRYGKDLEREADAVGVELVHRAGFEPVGALTTLERLWGYQLQRPRPELGVYATHPELEERIAHVGRRISELGLRVRRKSAVPILVPSLELEGGEWSLKVDGSEVLRLPEASRDLADSAFAVLLELELEMEPYEVEASGPNLTLWGRPALDLGDPALASLFRDNIRRALSRAYLEQPRVWR